MASSSDLSEIFSPQSAGKKPLPPPQYYFTSPSEMRMVTPMLPEVIPELGGQKGEFPPIYQFGPPIKLNTHVQYKYDLMTDILRKAQLSAYEKLTLEEKIAKYKENLLRSYLASNYPVLYSIADTIDKQKKLKEYKEKAAEYDKLKKRWQDLNYV